MLATTLIFTVGAAAGFAWFKLLRPLARVLELSDESAEMPWVMAAQSQGFGTQDLIPLMSALNAHGSVSPAPATRSEEMALVKTNDHSAERVR